MILHPHLSIVRACTIPDSCVVHAFVNMYETTLGEHVKVFPFVELGGCKIGDRTKISTHSYIPPHCEVGSDCFIAHGVKCCNDAFRSPLEYDHIDELSQEWKPRGVKIGNCVRIGSNAVIMAGVEIGDHAIIGAGAVVTRNVGAHEIVAGVPARLIDTTSNPWEQFS